MTGQYAPRGLRAAVALNTQLLEMPLFLKPRPVGCCAIITSTIMIGVISGGGPSSPVSDGLQLAALLAQYIAHSGARSFQITHPRVPGFAPNGWPITMRMVVVGILRRGQVIDDEVIAKVDFEGLPLLGAAISAVARPFGLRCQLVQGQRDVHLIVSHMPSK